MWRDLDYLIIDIFSGTIDEYISVIENLKVYNFDGVILVIIL